MPSLPLVKLMPSILQWRTSTELSSTLLTSPTLYTKLFPCNLVDVENHVYTGLRFLLEFNLYLEQNNLTDIYLIDYPEYASNEEYWHTLIMSESYEQVEQALNWCDEYASWYKHQSLYFKSQPWLPEGHYQSLNDLALAPNLSQVEYELPNFDGSAVFSSVEWTHWKWIKKNCSGQVWRWDKCFWFENANDATLYKVFADSLATGEENG